MWNYKAKKGHGCDPVLTILNGKVNLKLALSSGHLWDICLFSLKSWQNGLFSDNLVLTYFEPLYGYLRTSLSWRVFHQVVDFSGQIVAYQGLLSVVKLLASSAQPQSWRKRENKQNKNSKRAAHFLADFFAIITRLMLSNFIIIATRSKM